MLHCTYIRQSDDWRVFLLDPLSNIAAKLWARIIPPPEYPTSECNTIYNESNTKTTTASFLTDDI
jgi:hypothetical protein